MSEMSAGCRVVFFFPSKFHSRWRRLRQEHRPNTIPRSKQSRCKRPVPKCSSAAGERSEVDSWVNPLSELWMLVDVGRLNLLEIAHEANDYLFQIDQMDKLSPIPKDIFTVVIHEVKSQKTLPSPGFWGLMPHRSPTCNHQHQSRHFVSWDLPSIHESSWVHGSLWSGFSWRIKGL